MTVRRAHLPVVLAGALLALVLAGCEGDGSDIGPRLDRLPDASCKVLVFDDANRPVTGARVEIDGAAAVTGRWGRCDLLANPRGLRLVRVSGAAASATATDRLASLAFLAAIAGPDLPFAVHLPDTAASPMLSVATGVALGATALDDTAGTGARLELAAGTVVAHGAAAEVTLRVAALAPHHLPGELPAAAAGAMLFTRGFQVEPAGVTFAPGATLEVPDELALPAAATATLHRLDPASGEWLPVGGPAAGAGGRLRADGAVPGGGTYVYAVEVAAAATVRGRLLDTRQRAVPDALVRVDALRATTASDGSFAVAGVAATLADGTPRTVAVELRAGGSRLAVGLSAATPPLPSGGLADLGDLELDTVPATNLRFQVVERGAATPLRRFAAGATDVPTAAVTLTDARGQCLIEGVPFGFFGFSDGYPADTVELFVIEALGFLEGGRRWSDFTAFFDDRAWFVGSRNTRALVMDSVGGGAVRDAAVVRGSTPGEGFVGITPQGGIVVVGRDFGGRATAASRTSYAGTTVVSAISIERPNAERLELPVDRALRLPGGLFDRHGLAAGTLPGFDPLAEQRLRATRLLEEGEWFDEILLGAPPASSVPVKVDPALPPGSYRAGVGAPLGSIAVAEGTTAGPVFTLARVGLATGLTAAQGEVTPLDLPLAHAAGTAFAAPRALAGLDPAFAPADLRIDLGLLRPDGLAVDVARDVGGNLVPAGQDATILLPALAGELLGHRWLVALRASAQTGGATAAQRLLLRLDADGGPPLGHLPLPDLTAPVDGAMVPADGFTAAFALPPGSLYGVLELASPGSERLRWVAVVPPGTVSFTFPRLPAQAPTPLVAGRTYTLTVTAARATSGIVVQSLDPYRDVTSFWHSVGAAERGVDAVSSRSVTITAN